MAKINQRPAAWFRESVKRERALSDRDDYIGARLEYQRREADKQYLKDSIKLLRRFADGFEARNGYTLKDVAHLTGKRLANVKKYAALIREEQASDHVEKIGRTKPQRDALATYTGQQWMPKRKRFIVHTPHPETTKVKLVKRSKKARPVVEVQEKVKGGTLADRFFHISDYRKTPATTFKQIAATVRKMLADMPDGYYVIVTSNHGHIGAPMERDRILHEIESLYFGYDILKRYEKQDGNISVKDNRGLAEVVVGFKHVSFTKDGAIREYNVRDTRRRALRKFRKDQRAAEGRRIRKRLR